MNLRYHFWKLIHNGFVHGLLMSWPWEPKWVERLHDWTGSKLSLPPRVLIVRLKVNDYFVEADNHTWASGKSVDEALGNWLRTHQKTEGFRITIT